MLNVTYLEDNYCFQSLLVPNSIGILVCVDFYSYSFDSRAKHCTLTTEYASLLEYQTLWPLQYWINNKVVQLFGYCYLLICRNIHLQVLPKHFYQAQGNQCRRRVHFVVWYGKMLIDFLQLLVKFHL